MNTIKILKRKRIGVICLLAIMTISSCKEIEEDTIPLVTGGNPPVIKFRGAGQLAQLYVSGPFTLEQLQQDYHQEYKITGGKNILTPEEMRELEKVQGRKKDVSIWQLDPNWYFKSSELFITYGIIPDGFKQVYPANSKPPKPLIEGKLYLVSAPTAVASSTPANTNTYFMIDNGRAIVVPPNQITR